MEYISEIISFIAGLGAGWTLNLVISRKSKKTYRKTTTRQDSNTAGGDIAGGDINKKG